MEQPEISHIKTTRRARVAKLGVWGRHTKHIWIVLHGYRQLVPHFIRKFRDLASEEIGIIAPEGLSRFYLDGYYGRVGASWMTKEDRLIEIEDQIDYLDQVILHVRELAMNPDLKIHMLGFSQGIATLWRWLLNTELKVHSAVFWTGRIPDEGRDEMRELLAGMDMAYVYATDDQFVPTSFGEQQGEGLLQDFPHLKVFRFDGKHDIHAETLLQVSATILGNDKNHRKGDE
ncbi:phospholipase [Pontibacter sp. G13]|uniref:alpha/beta hydrolase n=1 Tax=Pontibacter sp. G13 TaxID=3074898 RepID=UPI00288BD464|nr:phospholipase [Pontibacter sp. G13]WNJ18553.1 phospholipase [Pontibacter sp. G13]